MMCWRNGVLVNWKNDDLFSDAKVSHGGDACRLKEARQIMKRNIYDSA